eukprot:SAG31_NODE_1992_length_6709_cov_3.654870_4_plen_80_part_00
MIYYDILIGVLRLRCDVFRFLRGGPSEYISQSLTIVRHLKWCGHTVQHLGGDEADTSCWNTDPAVVAWREKHNRNDTGR